jgi:hypothetical protein
MSLAFPYKKIELLPDHLKVEVNDFIDFLLLKEKKKAQKAPKENLSIVQFSGIIPDEVASEWEKSIAECRKIDLNEW